MFTIILKDFNGRQTERYFKSWDKAKKEMDKDIEVCCKDLNGTICETLDNFNSDKGVYIYEKTASFDNGEKCTWALIEEYFEDE